jgi:hypothetical protein
MRRRDERRTNGASLSATIMLIAAVSILGASSAVIIGVEESGIMDWNDTNCLQPYFHLKAEPLHRNATVNENVTYEISMVPHIYLYAPCYLTVLDMYDGVMSSLEPNVIYPDEVAILELRSIGIGYFFREVVGTFNGQEDRVTVTLTVIDEEVSPGSGEFELKVEPASQTVEIKRPASYSIFIEPGEDFNGKVELEVLDCYDGVISILKPEMISAEENAVLVLTPMFSGEFSRIIVARNEDNQRSIQVFLTVKDRNSYGE